METPYHYIKTRKEDHIFHLILARPAKRNAFTPATISEIAHAIEQINQDDGITVVVLSAEGPVFCAGMDLKTFRDESLDVRNEAIPHIDISLGEVFTKLHKPSIAVVEGDVIAGGFLYVLGCTYVFAKPEVRFRLPELDLGIFPFQVMASLLRVVPEKKVLQLCLNTDYFSVEEALSVGIVDGYLEEGALQNLLDKFAKANVSVLKAGFESICQLKSIPTEKQYSYLMQVLDKLR
ncbi:enoyl-CoA hydratase/isomerase family protein [Sphingobacterium corticibacter]|uniref:Enoyl-CoA hydratase/isomerase family protein n=1 Tax=Sphingobacterium corticibacter TaxID=2171749 RepID=A0A2T8HK19_9SPHI|nr:enoyl-CoA hydratase/isomerase family protein [Sphingobacterium corticibacter]PVH25807.1 enoyl-CoA hydratase/isomerase family protein [Sphingobacterium corticibacter]